MTENLHIGAMIKAQFEKSGLSAAEFARRIHRDRSTIYSVFERSSIDADLLARICIALNHNFFTEIAQHYGLKSIPSHSLTIHIGNLSPEAVKYLSEFFTSGNDSEHPEKR